MKLSAYYKASPLAFVTHALLLFLVVLWTIPTFGLFISSFRESNAIAATGWWTAMLQSENNVMQRTAAADTQLQENGVYTITGNLLENPESVVISFGTKAKNLSDFQPGETVQINDSSQITVQANGDYIWQSSEPFSHKKGRRIFMRISTPPSFSLDNYKYVLFSEGLGQAFVNTFTVTIPATFIPILLAAFAAYAFAWMDFPGRKVLFITIVALLVVPLQMALIPLLSIYNSIGAFLGVSGKSYPGVWLAHTGFGLPMAIYLLRNYMTGLPKEVFESARIEGASHFQVFTRLVLPLSTPALAAFAIFQFLWVWNDLLVALVFLGSQTDQVVMTSKLRQLMGTYGGEYEVLTASAFVTIVVPLVVFLGLQKYFVRGLVAGSVKE